MCAPWSDMPEPTEFVSARARLKRQFPYFASVIHLLSPYPTEAVAQMALSSKHVLAYNPKWFGALSLDEAAGALLRIVFHVVYDMVYQDKTDGFKEAALYKADFLAANEAVHRSSMRLPPGYIKASDVGMSGTLLDLYRHIETKGEPSIEEQILALLFKLSPNPIRHPGNYRCDVEDDELNDKLNALVPSKTQAHTRHAAVALANDIALQGGSGRGSVPGDIAEWARVTVAPPKIPWYSRLASILRATVSSANTAHNSMASYSRPHPMTFVNDCGIIYPGEIGSTAKVVVIIDTSGSMGGEQVTIAIREIRGVLMGLGLHELLLLQADTKVHKEQMLTVDDLNTGKFQIVGRGGTDFVQPLARAAELGAEAVIYMTDGDGACPPKPPTFPVHWCLIGANKETKMPFGKQVIAD